MKKKVQMFKEIESYDQLRYPEDYAAVMRGDAYWYPDPITLLDYQNKFCDLGTYNVYDMNHPRCYHCGKFIRKGDWWKGIYTGPCIDCYEDLRWL